MKLPDTFLKFFALSLIFLNLFNFAVCYTIDASCGHWVDILMAAAEEAFRLAEHAVFRVDQNPPVGRIVENLIGHPDGLDNFKKHMSRVKREVKEYHSSGYHGPIIKCGDNHLRYIPQRKLWEDPEFPQMQPFAPDDGRVRFCINDVYATTYYTADANAPAVIILCYHGKGAYSHRNVGIFKDWNLPLDGLELDFLEDFLSLTILHEFLHAMDEQQFPGTLPGNVAEAYGDDALKLPNHLKQYNADSYAMLATALYFRLAPIDENGVFQRRYEKHLEPPKGPHPQDNVVGYALDSDSDSDDSKSPSSSSSGGSLKGGVPRHPRDVSMSPKNISHLD